jgi:hypothetical protein
MVTKVTAANIQDKVTTGDKAAALINDNKRAINQVIDAKEESLGNPVNDGRLLTSTAAGVRSWVDVGRSRTFKSLTDAVDYVTLNPATLDQVTTVSDKSESECISLGIDYPDGNGGDYIVVEDESLIVGEVIAAGVKQLKLITLRYVPIGTAASKDTGTEAGQVPLNSDLGSASLADTGSAQEQVPLNSNLGSASKINIGTNFDQIPLNTNIVYPVATVADLRLLEPTVDNQQVSLLGHTLAGIGGGDFYAMLNDASGVDNNGTKFMTAGGHSWNRKNPNQSTAEDFGLIIGSGDNTAILQNYADYACTYSKLFELPAGIIRTDSIVFNNAAGLKFCGVNPFATQIRPFTPLGTTELFKFLPKDDTSGAAITGLSISNFSIAASGYSGVLIDISSVFDSTVVEFIRCDKFVGSAVTVSRRDASRPTAYNFVEGFILKDSVFIGDQKSDFVSVDPVLNFPTGGNECTIHDTKVYCSRVASSTVDSAADLALNQSRSALKISGVSRGWDVHNFTCAVAMNTRMIDIEDGKAHRIYSIFFERVGEFVSGGIPTTSDSCLIYWRQAGGLTQINGGTIIGDRVEFPISLRKSIILDDCARVSYRGSAFSPADFDLSTADDCLIECNRDQARENERGADEVTRNTIINHTGSFTQFANKLSVTKRTDTGSKDENASFPTVEWDQGLSSSNVQRGRVHAELTSTDGVLGNSRLDFTTGIGSATESRAMSIYRGGVVFGSFAGAPTINGFSDPGSGSVIYDSINDRFLFRHATGWKTPTMTDV